MSYNVEKSTVKIKLHEYTRNVALAIPQNLFFTLAYCDKRILDSIIQTDRLYTQRKQDKRQTTNTQCTRKKAIIRNKALAEKGVSYAEI